MNQFPFVVAFKCSEDTKNKLDEISSSLPISKRKWFETVVDREYKALKNDKSHYEDMEKLIDILDYMVAFQKAFDSNKARVNDSVKALNSLKAYLSSLIE